MIKLRIENTYECGQESERVVEVRDPAPGEDLETWWAEAVHPETGDGHACGWRNDGYCHTATVLEADDPELLAGDTYEWVGR